jgi:hypothetical protein
MQRYAALPLLLPLLFAAPASAVTVDLVAGSGALSWDTSVSVTSPGGNASVTHPEFPANRHTHEGWFIYIEQIGTLYEFTNFTKIVDGASQDTLNETYYSVFGDPFVLSLTYGLTAVGPDGIPSLGWSGTLYRGVNPLSPFPTLTVRLINVFDYDIGVVASADTAVASQPSGPDLTVIDLEDPDGATGQRGVYGHVNHTADTLANVLTQVQVSHILNDVAAAGSYDVAGAFLWTFEMCSSSLVPDCDSSGGNGSGPLGGFAGYTITSEDPLPEPAAAILLSWGLVLLLRRTRPKA